jgi:hypothetical protein
MFGNNIIEKTIMEAMLLQQLTDPFFPFPFPFYNQYKIFGTQQIHIQLV